MKNSILVQESMKAIKNSVISYMCWSIGLIAFIVFCDGVQFSHFIYKAIFIALVFVISACGYMVGYHVATCRSMQDTTSIIMDELMTKIGCTEDEAMECINNPNMVEFYIDKYEKKEVENGN